MFLLMKDVKVKVATKRQMSSRWPISYFSEGDIDSGVDESTNSNDSGESGRKGL